MSSWWYSYHRWRAQDETDQCLVKHTVVLNWECANGWRCSKLALDCIPVEWVRPHGRQFDTLQMSGAQMLCNFEWTYAYICFSTCIYIYIYIMYFYIHTCGGQSKGALASARGQWFLKGFKIMIKTKTSSSHFQMPFSSKSCEFGRFQVVLNGRIGCYWIFPTYLCYILTNLSYLLYKCVMTLCVKECILRAYLPRFVPGTHATNLALVTH